MTRTRNTLITAATSLLALSLTLGLLSASAAQARPAYMKLEDIKGESASTAKPRIARGFTGRTVCCHLPRPGLLGVLTPAQCKERKGRIVPAKKCAKAGARASDAFFVKVDRGTTTQSARDNLTLKRGRPGR